MANAEMASSTAEAMAAEIKELKETVEKQQRQLAIQQLVVQQGFHTKPPGAHVDNEEH